MYVDELFFITIPAILIAIVFVLISQPLSQYSETTPLRMILNNANPNINVADFDIF